MKVSDIQVPFCGLKISITKKAADRLAKRIHEHFRNPTVRLAADANGDICVHETPCSFTDTSERWYASNISDGSQGRSLIVKLEAVEFDVADYEWQASCVAYGKQEFLDILQQKA